MEETIQAADLVQVIEHAAQEVQEITPTIVKVKELKEADYEDPVSEEYKTMRKNMTEPHETMESPEGIEMQHHCWHVAGECQTK